MTASRPVLPVMNLETTLVRATWEPALALVAIDDRPAQRGWDDS